MDLLKIIFNFVIKGLGHKDFKILKNKKCQKHLKNYIIQKNRKINKKHKKVHQIR